MPDITMCINSAECPKRLTCYRANAKPDYLLQSYAEFYKPGFECKEYWRDDPMYFRGIGGYLQQLDDYWAATNHSSQKYDEIITLLSSNGYEIQRNENGKHSIN